MKCPHCNHWMTLIHDFPKNVIELPKDSRGLPNHDVHLSHPFIRPNDTHAYVCTKCQRLISDETRILGLWRPLYEYKKDVRGYQISQLICPWISATQLMKKRNDYLLDQLFENYVIGRPYLGDNVLVTRSDIMRCVDRSMTNPYDYRLDNICQGVDWGNRSWGVNGARDPQNPDRFVLLDIWDITDNDAVTSNGRRDNPHIRKVGEKMRSWNVRRGVFDAGYGKDKNWELMNDFPKKVFGCFYPNLSTDATKNTDDVWSDNDNKVSVDRTMTLRIMCKMFQDGKFVIPAWVADNPLFETFIQHVTNLVLISDVETDEKTKKEVIKQRVGTLPGGDHFGHAMNYLTIALRKMTGSGRSAFWA